MFLTFVVRPRRSASGSVLTRGRFCGEIFARSGMYKVLLVTIRAVFPTFVVRPRCSASGSVWTRGTGMLNDGVAALVFECGNGMFGWFCWRRFLRFISFCCRRQDRAGILVGMDQKDFSRFPVVHTSTVCNDRAMGYAVQKTVEFPQLLSMQVVDISFVVQRPISMVLVSMEIPQLRVDTVVDGPFCSRAVFCRDVEVCPKVQTVCWITGILQLLHTVFDALLCRACLVVDIPVVVQRPFPMVLPVRKTIETLRFSTFPGGRCFCCTGRASSHCCCYGDSRTCARSWW